MSRPKSVGLTLRQLQILHELACGETIEELARKTNHSPQAITRQLSEIRKKLGTGTSICAVVIALYMGLIPFPSWPKEKGVRDKKREGLALSKNEKTLLMAMDARDEEAEIYRKIAQGVFLARERCLIETKREGKAEGGEGNENQNPCGRTAKTSQKD